MEFLITVLTVYGLSAIVTQSKIFRPLRDFAEVRSPDFWYHLVSCMQCFPFWGGVFITVLTDAPLSVSLQGLPSAFNLLLTYLLCGALFSGTSMLLHTFHVHLMGDRWIKKEEKEKIRKMKKGIIVTRSPVIKTA